LSIGQLPPSMPRCTRRPKSPGRAHVPVASGDAPGGELKPSAELEREDDGRWIAEAREIPGVMCYGTAREEAIGNTERLAIEVIADRIAHGELPASSLNLS